MLSKRLTCDFASQPKSERAQPPCQRVTDGSYLLGENEHTDRCDILVTLHFQGKSDHYFLDVATFTATLPVFKVTCGLHLMLKPLQIQIGVYVYKGFGLYLYNFT